MYITFLSYYPYSKFPIKQVRKSEEQIISSQESHSLEKASTRKANSSSKSLRKSLSKLATEKANTQGGRYRRIELVKKDHPEEAR